MPTLAMNQLEDLVARGLERAGAGATMARVTAEALVAAEAEGMSSHGLFRATQYAAHLKSGRADGTAKRSASDTAQCSARATPSAAGQPRGP